MLVIDQSLTQPLSEKLLPEVFGKKYSVQRAQDFVTLNIKQDFSFTLAEEVSERL